MLDTGDALIGGDRLGDRTQGEAIVAGMNLMGYDAMALGPQELALGLDALRQRMAEAKFPMLSANVALDGGDLLAKPYTILKLGEHRVGVIGLTRTPAEPMTGFQVRDPKAAAEQYVPEVAQQAGTIVVLTNLDYQSALALAAVVPGIDLVVAALPEQAPEQAVRVPDTGALLVAADQSLPLHSGRRVGKMAVTVNGDGSLSGESWTSVPMSAAFADDPEMQALLDTYQQ